MNTNLEPPDSRNHPPPDLTEALIIILISAAILIFVFWISTQFVGQDRFTVLPNYVVAVFKNIWSSIVTGAAGIGLAILNAFNKRGLPHPNYSQVHRIYCISVVHPNCCDRHIRCCV